MANLTVYTAASAGALAIGAAATLPLAGPTTIPAGTSITASAPMTDGDAARLAKQATFGATPAVVARIKSLGAAGWLDEQFAAKSSTYSDLIAMDKRKSFCRNEGKSVPNCFHVYQDSVLPAMRFYANGLSKDDQLRQRVALALFNMMPVSAIKVEQMAALARYQQIMLDGAFGNFADLLKSVVLSGAMGYYLDLGDSSKIAPNENLARELLQLFSMGPVSLGTDGTIRLDANGAAIPNYSTKDISELARALTGWTYARWPGVKDGDDAVDMAAQMVPQPVNFDAGSKTFLGVNIPAGTSQSDNLDLVIRRIVKDASTAPRVSKILIESLVRSNPSPAYVGRVAAVFRNDGAGVTGDLRAVVRAILLDREARQTPDGSPSSGKLKDPELLMLSVARAVGMSSDGYIFSTSDTSMGQQFLRPPSVFSDFQPDFPLPGVKGLVSPASKLMSVDTIMARHNFVWQWTMNGDTVRARVVTPSWIPGGGTVNEDWSSWEAFGDNVDAMIDRIDLLMLGKAMTPDQRKALKTAMLLVTVDNSPTLQARRRAQTGLYIVGSSPQFQVDR